MLQRLGFIIHQLQIKMGSLVYLSLIKATRPIWMFHYVLLYGG